MKILIVSGGSGGHIFPAIALAKELEKEKAEIIFVASRRCLDGALLQKVPYKKVFLSVNPMPYRLNHEIFIFLIKFISDSLRSLYILVKHRPRVVVGFGGYAGGALVLLASLINIKTIIHEQNVVPGRANKFLDTFVDEIGVSFSETKKYFKNRNVVFTGNPLREESLVECRDKAFKDFILEKDKMTILVMGGSQGAKSLNDLVSRSLCLLPGEKKRNIQIIHITGPMDKDSIEARYDENGIEGKVFDFIEKINEAYSMCNLAISRSGAAAVFELAAFKIPMILIPYPSHMNNQRFNAIFFAEKNAAIYRDEKGLEAEELKDIIIDLIDNPDKRKYLSENAGTLSILDGAKRLKEVILKLQMTNYK